MQMIGSIFGYLLWWLYLVFKNYGVAVILFTLIIKAITFPLNVKQQKSMATQSRMAAKQKEIQERYPNDKQKQSEEIQKLYEKEGTTPMSGCLVQLLPLLVMFGVIYACTSPLSNTLHIEKDHVNEAISYISRVPGMASSAGGYQELQIVQNFDALEDNFAKAGIFTQTETEKIELFNSGLNIFGLDLTQTPKNSPFGSFMWVIPVLTLILNFLMQLYMNKTNPAMQSSGQQQGCMKLMLYLSPLLSAYYAYAYPGALGVYWIAQAAGMFIQQMVTRNFFSTEHMIAKQEASRSVTLELKEEKIRPLPAAAQQQIALQLERAPQQAVSKDKSKKQTGGKKKQKNQGNNSSQYRGNKI